MKIYHFTHTDLDGVSCAALAQLYARMTGDEIETHYVDYDNVEKEINDYLDNGNKVSAALLITDLSISDELAEKIDKTVNSYGNTLKVRLMDHHKTSEHMNYPWCRIVVNGIDSATSIAARCFFDEAVTAIMSFADAVAEYDTYRFDKTKLGLPQQLNHFCYMVDHDTFIKYVIDTITDHPYASFQLFDETILKFIKYKEEQAHEYTDRKTDEAKIIEANGHKIACVYAENNISLVGNTIATKYGTNIDYVAVIEMGKSVHLRGLDHSPDLSEIAKQHGGGGHQKAAAYPITEIDPIILLGDEKNETVQTDE